MISKWLRTVLISALVVPTLGSAQIGLTIDNKLLFPLTGLDSDLDAPAYVIDAGFGDKGGNPAIRYLLADSRLVMQTRYADLTCEYFDAAGQPIVPPSGSFTIEIDRIPTPLGGPDPNVDYLGAPIQREFTLDVAGGASITQMFLAEGPLLDICSSAAGCGDPQGVNVRCRQAGTAVFSGDFEAPVLSLLGSAESSSASAVAGSSTEGSFELDFAIENQGDLSAPDLTMLVSLDALPPGVTAVGVPLPSVGTYDLGTGVWDIGELEPGTTATLNFTFSAEALAPDGIDYCGAMTLNSVGGDPINPAAANAAVCVDLVRRVDLATAARLDPKGTEAVNVTNGDVSYSYIFSVSNSGPSNASGVAMALDLQLPPGVLLDAVNTFDGSYDAPSGIWTIGPISSGSGGRQIRADVTVTQGTTPGTDVICAGISTSSINETRINLADDQVQECTSVIGPPTVDLIAEVEVSNAMPVAGSGAANLVLTHRITNNTAIEATGIQATVDAVTTPPSVTLDSEQVGAGSMLTGTLWEIPSLAPSQSIEVVRTFTVAAAALSGDQLCGGLGSLSANEDLISTTDDDDNACAIIARQVDLQLQVFNTAPTVQPGATPGTPTFQFSVSNLGPSNASSIELQLSELPLPNGVSRGAPFIVGGTFAGSTWSIGSLAVGQPSPSLSLSYTVGSPAAPGESIEASVALQSLATGEQVINPGNDSATAVTTIVTP